MRRWFLACLVSACGQDAVVRDAPEATPDGGAALELLPPVFDFGNSVLGSMIPGETSGFTLHNTGDGDATIASIAITGASDFTIVSEGCADILSPGGTCGVTVQFDAIARDARSATLEVTGSHTATAALSGTGTITSGLVIDPGARNFGDLAAATTSGMFRFNVFNELADSVLAPSLTHVGPPGFTIAATDCTGTIALHGTCSVDVVFAPPHGGEFRGDLTITGATDSVRAGVTGASTTPLAITPFTRLFGSMLLGEVGSTQTLTVRNTTTVPSGTLAPALIGAAAADFTIQSTTCTTLAPDATCDVVVKLTATTRGAKTAQLEVTDATNAVSARGTLRGDAYSLLVIGSATFPNTVSGQTSARQTYTVINASSSPTGAIATTLPGTQFSIASNTCAAGLPANMSCAIEIEFKPTSTGAKSATLSVSASPGGSDDFVIGGTGT
jgi:hypothetical protein